MWSPPCRPLLPPLPPALLPPVALALPSLLLALALTAVGMSYMGGPTNGLIVRDDPEDQRKRQRPVQRTHASKERLQLARHGL